MTHAQFIAHLQGLVTAAGGQSAFARLYGRKRQEIHDYLQGKIPAREFLTRLGFSVNRKSVYTFEEIGGKNETTKTMERG